MELWVDKYKPKSLSELAGQGKAVREVLSWLESYSPGKALMITGPVGSGKSLVPEAVASERGWEIQRLNAYEKRGKEQIEGFSQTATIQPLFSKGKLILIDELDGISGRERGAAGGIADLVKKSRFPVFLVALDPYLPKLKPLRAVSQMVKLTKVPTPSIAKRLRDICKSEGLSCSDDILKDLARWSSGDLRSAINDLQTLAQGKKEITEKDLSVLGYRERENTLFNTLPTIFRSGSIKLGRKTIFETDKDADDVFWWLETNAPLEFPPEALPAVYDLLSKADLFRARVMRQQNWRFKAYMSDLLAGISTLNKDPSHGYTPYKMPDRIMVLGRTKFKRALQKTLCQKIGEITHCSSRIVKRDYLPYLSIVFKKKGIFGLDLEPEEAKLLISG